MKLLYQTYNFFLVFLLSSLATFAQGNIVDSVTTLTNKKAPNFILKTMDGVIYNSDLLRGKVIVLNFWDTSCKPCIEEMPELYKIYSDFKDSGVVFISACKALEPQILKLKERANISFDIVPDTENLNLSYKINNTYPTTVFINKDGFVVDNLVGAAPSYVRKAIRKLIK